MNNLQFCSYKVQPRSEKKVFSLNAFGSIANLPKDLIMQKSVATPPSRKQSRTLSWIRAAVRVPTVALMLATNLMWSSHSQGATLYWDVNGTGAGFSTVVGAWNGTNNFFNTDSTGGAGTLSATVGTTNDLIIPAATTNTGSITLTGTQSASSLTFAPTVGAVTITGGTLSIGGTGASSGIFNGSASLQTISSALALNTNSTLSSTGAGGITVGGIISGANTLTINNTGAGVTTLSGVNTYTGGTALRAGILTTATSSSALGTGTFTLGNTSGATAATLRVSTPSQPRSHRHGNLYHVQWRRHWHEQSQHSWCGHHRHRHLCDWRCKQHRHNHQLQHRHRLRRDQ
jgi:autotransporter-associated beta strand protein